MFKHVDYLQFQAKPEKPDALFAAKMQELVGGQFGEMTVMMQYLWQGWNCRVPGKYKDMIMDIATEEIGHVEMLTTMLARLLEGAPNETTEKAAAANPVLAAVLGGMNPQHAIVTGGGALPRDAAGVPWNTGYIVASGNLLSDFRSNVAAEAQSRLMTSRVYNMTDDRGVKDMLQFNLARDTWHQQQWLLGIEQLIEDGFTETGIEDSNREDEKGAGPVPGRPARHRVRPGRHTAHRRQAAGPGAGPEAVRHLRRLDGQGQAGHRGGRPRTGHRQRGQQGQGRTGLARPPARAGTR
jgi:Mn-containing catalase